MPQMNKLGLLWIDTQERWLARIGRLRLLAAPAIPPHLATGLRGESAALFELRRRGIVVVARRWTTTTMRGDIDLIGWDDDQLCFIEVKTRTARDFNPAESAVDEEKRRMLRGLARTYLRSFPERERQTIPIRFDVVAVYFIGGATEFEVFQNAFSRA
jgi:putative endonuclease